MPQRDESESARKVLLRATRMSKSFGPKLAVSATSITLRAGQIHALLGENGAGKSTLISMLSGEYKPDEGEIEIYGHVTRLATPKNGLDHGVGVVHQDFRLVGAFTVLENLVLGTKFRPNNESWTRSVELMRGVGFELSRDTRVSTLSVGEKQQLEILRLLFRGARVLILDEPTAVLTPQQSEALFNALRLLADQGKAIMFVSHKLREVTRVADWITIMRGGHRVLSQRLGETTHAELAGLMMGVNVDDAVTLPPREPGSPLLCLTGVHTSPGRRSSLRGLDVTVHEGEIVGVAGVSGNGQTDLADLAANLIRPTSGSRVFTANRLGYVPEDRLETGLVGQMTIAENLAFRNYRDSSRYHPIYISRKKLNADAVPLIENFAIPSPGYIRAGELSGGGQQRTILAREMTAHPDLLVACQPTRGLDVLSAVGVHDQLLAVRERNGGVLLISEDLDELLKLSDRILVIVNGHIAADISRDVANRTLIGSHMTGMHAEKVGVA